MGCISIHLWIDLCAARVIDAGILLTREEYSSNPIDCKNA